MKETRNKLKKAKRIVVKVGSRVLVDSTGKPDHERIHALVSDVAQSHDAGCEMILVSSGAIAAGIEALGMTKRPTALPDLQMAAAVGQTRLMSLYSHLFGQKHIKVGQVLLTNDIFQDEDRRANAQNTLLNLIKHRIVPVINENDTVATEEIKFGDNDLLAALVSVLVKADALIMLSTTDGLRDDRGYRVPLVKQVSKDILALDKGKNGELSTGGMTSKLMSAGKAAATRIPVVIADGRVANIISTVLSGGDIGTLIMSRSIRNKAHQEKIFMSATQSVINKALYDGTLKTIVDSLRMHNLEVHDARPDHKGRIVVKFEIQKKKPAGEITHAPSR